MEYVSYTLAVNETSGATPITTNYEVSGPKSADFAYLKKGAMVAVVGNYLCVPACDKVTGKTVMHHYVSTFRFEVIRAGNPAAASGKDDLPER